jgi:hypothetical protein
MLVSLPVSVTVAFVIAICHEGWGAQAERSSHREDCQQAFHLSSKPFVHS